MSRCNVPAHYVPHGCSATAPRPGCVPVCLAGTWAYFCTVITTFVYTLVPFVSLVWGVHPVSLSWDFSLAATLYFAAGAAVNFHVHKLSHLQGLWLALMSNHLLAFTYFKATINTLL